MHPSSLFRARRAQDESGFTLIELMVVVLIIAILVAIALPTFLGARKRAADRAAETRVRTAFTSAKIYYIDDQSFMGADGVGVLESIDSSVHTNTLATAIQSEVSVRDVSDDTIVLVSRSTSGAFVCMGGDTNGQVRGLDESGDTFATLNDCATAPESW